MARSRNAYWLVAALGALVWMATTFISHVGGPPGSGADKSLASDAALVERGRYLVLAGNCASCHTRPGGAPYSGGVAFETPFGRLYSSNITADRVHGIGNWSLGDLERALHEGVSARGHLLFPAFPYPSFTKTSS